MHSSLPTQGKVFCFGMGYVAERFARTFYTRGLQIHGTARSEAKCCQMASNDFVMHVWNDQIKVPPSALSGVTHILVSVAPNAHGDPVCRNFGKLIASLPRLQWLGYLSSTSVYGNHDGAWVDETTPPAPVSSRGEWRLRAEEQWLSLGVPAHIFRLSGIYGPGRNALTQVMQGKTERIFKEGQVFSRVHVDDIVRTLLASVANPNPKSIYNVTDDAPAPSHEVTAFACQLLGIELTPLIPYEQAELSPMAQDFYAANRRVSNRKINEELGVELKYPDYVHGLQALKEIDRQPEPAE